MYIDIYDGLGPDDTISTDGECSPDEMVNTTTQQPVKKPILRSIVRQPPMRRQQSHDRTRHDRHRRNKHQASRTMVSAIMDALQFSLTPNEYAVEYRRYHQKCGLIQDTPNEHAARYQRYHQKCAVIPERRPSPRDGYQRYHYNRWR